MTRVKKTLMFLVMIPGLLFIGLALAFAWLMRVCRATGDAMLPRWAHKTQIPLKDAWARMTPEQREQLIARMRAGQPQPVRVVERADTEARG